MPRRIVRIAVPATLVLVAAVAFLLLGEPALADAQLAADNHALAQVARHQSTIDTALQQFLTPSSGGGGEPDDRLLTQSSQNLAEYESARSLLDHDMASLQQAMTPAWLVAAAWSRSDQMSAARQRTDATVAALRQADTALTAAIDQERLQNGFFFAAVNEAKMLTAVDDQQYVAIDGLYARADRALKVSEALMGKPDEPRGYQPVIQAMQSVLDQTQKYGDALLRNDQPAATAYHAQMRAGYARLAAATSDASVTANDDWNARTYEPVVAAYHSGLAAILS